MARSLCLFVTAVLACALFATPAAASHVNCGDVLTQDTTLDSDLVCPADALKIGADGVTLDLAGHTITGPGTSSGAVAVDDILGFDGLTVTDGVIRGFSTAVRAHDSTGGELSHLDFEVSLSLRNSEGYTIHSNTSLQGVVLGVQLSASRISDNTFDNGLIQIIVGDDLVIDRNAISTPGIGGIVLATVSETTVTRNVIRAPGTAAGIELNSSTSSTTLERNVITGGSSGIRMASVRIITVVRNDISGAAGDGILATNTDASLFERNDAHGNGDDGIDIDSVGPFTGPNTVTRNTANFNGDLGIEAVSGTIDGGGNKAKGNGNPAQCVGVTCK